jgi:hypothetical protein
MGKCISLFLSADGLGNSTKTLPGILESKLNPQASGLCWDTKTLSGVTRIKSKPLANAFGFDCILAHPRGFWYLNIDPRPRVYTNVMGFQ